MDTSLPPVPDDLWPLAHPAKASVPKGHMLCLEIPGMSERLVLSVLSRAVLLEMRAAGEWAARVGTASDKDYPSAKACYRYRAENAARLLALYIVLFATSKHVAGSDTTPDALKASATHCYQVALRDERASLQTRSPAYNDASRLIEKSDPSISPQR